MTLKHTPVPCTCPSGGAWTDLNQAHLPECPRSNPDGGPSVLEIMLAALRSNLEYLELKAQGFAAQYPADHCINLTIFRQLEQTRQAISKAIGE